MFEVGFCHAASDSDKIRSEIAVTVSAIDLTAPDIGRTAEEIGLTAADLDPRRADGNGATPGRVITPFVHSARNGPTGLSGESKDCAELRGN